MCMTIARIVRDWAELRLRLGAEIGPPTILPEKDDGSDYEGDEAVVRIVCDYAAKFLSRHWDTITEVARLVLERGTLTEKEVAAVIQRPSPAAPDRPRMQ